MTTAAPAQPMPENAKLTADPSAKPPPRKRVRRRQGFKIADQTVASGKRARIELPIANLMSGTPVALPMVVSHGRTDGPTMWLTAAIHGDEIAGVEIIRRVHEVLDPKTMSGTVIALPVVNVHGFNTGDRYLPDRRDLNRSFPGTRTGSLASRIAHLMMNEVVARSDVGIDLHTGSAHRTNLPQIRANLDDRKTLRIAKAFGAPIAIHSHTRDGSLRQAATEADSTVLLFEGGEADRFDETAIEVGVAGVLRVLKHQGITEKGPRRAKKGHVSRSTRWARAARSGIVHMDRDLGDHVTAGEVIATIYDPFGKRLSSMKARHDGIIIGRMQRPLVNRGDAVVHIASLDESAVKKAAPITKVTAAK